MQVTNINKTINLLIVGSFALLNFIVVDLFTLQSWHIKGILNFIENNSIAELQIILGFFVLALIIFLGLIIETIAEIFRERFHKIITKFKIQRIIAKLFFNKSEYLRYAFWKNRLTEKMQMELKNIDSYSGVGTGIFFEKARDASINWIISHYVTHLMATDFAIILVMNLLFFIFYMQWVFATCTLILIWLLISQSIGKFFYAYSFSYRFSYFYLSNFFKKYDYLSTEIEETENEDHNEKGDLSSK